MEKIGDKKHSVQYSVFQNISVFNMKYFFIVQKYNTATNTQILEVIVTAVLLE